MSASHNAENVETRGVEHACGDALSALVQIAECGSCAPSLSATLAAKLLHYIADLDKAAAAVAPLRRTLQFYADGNHFSGEEWEDVTGEAPNWLYNPHGDTIEDGSIAKAALEDPPRYIVDEEDPQEDLPL